MKKYNIDTDPILSKLDVICWVECEKCHSTIPYVYAHDWRNTPKLGNHTFYCDECDALLKRENK